MSETSEGESSRGRAFGSRMLLIFLFLASFSLPIIFGIKFFGFNRTENSPVDSGKIDPVFPQSVSITSQGSFLKFSNAKDLSPKSGENFLLTAWFKLRRLPQPGERMLLFSKIDQKSSFDAGYSLALRRRGGVIRPVVHWRDRLGRGALYVFSDVSILPRTWMMFALSYRSNGLLGLHVVTLAEGEKPKIDLLGGYRIPDGIVPEGEGDLVFGSQDEFAFRGKLGPVGVYSGKALSKDLRGIIKAIAKDPLDLPSAFSEDDIRLWCSDGHSDLSSYSRSVMRPNLSVEAGKKSRSAHERR